MVSIKLAAFVALFCVVCSAPADKVPQIVSQNSEVSPDGKFHYSFETEDGIKAQQDGEVKVIDKDNVAEVVRGQYSYQDSEGKLVSVSYIADENGYQPSGDILPVGPPIPPQIARALEYIANHPQPENNKQ